MIHELESYDVSKLSIKLGGNGKYMSGIGLTFKNGLKSPLQQTEKSKGDKDETLIKTLSFD